ncbi:MAG TPA: hypothetical protein PKV72_02675 [Candidatus Peribacteria bacterium]|nr:hypothetical protein [Candidatus Peribacteria bacterium]
MRKKQPDIAGMMAKALARPELESDVLALEAAERAERETVALLKMLVRGVRMKAEEIEIEDVLDPSRGDALDAWHNHPGVNSGLRTVEVALRKDQALAQAFAEAVNNSGAFYQQYVNETRGRIDDGMHTRGDGGGWKIFVGSGRIRSNSAPFHLGARQNYAHGDFLFPADKKGVEPVVPLPTGKQDIVFPSGKHILDEILADPACAFLIADICSYPQGRQLGVASKVEDHAFDLARQMNAGTGRAHQLKYAVSAMANVVSVTDENDGVVWTFAPSALNLISLVMHTKRAVRQGTIIGEQREQKIAEITLDDRRYTINGDWYIAAQRTDATGKSSSVSVPTNTPEAQTSA